MPDGLGLHSEDRGSSLLKSLNNLADLDLIEAIQNCDLLPIRNQVQTELLKRYEPLFKNKARRFVSSQCMAVSRRQSPGWHDELIAELLQVARISALEAATRFDLSKKNSFAAWCAPQIDGAFTKVKRESNNDFMGVGRGNDWVCYGSETEDLIENKVDYVAFVGTIYDTPDYSDYLYFDEEDWISRGTPDIEVSHVYPEYRYWLQDLIDSRVTISIMEYWPAGAVLSVLSDSGEFDLTDRVIASGLWMEGLKAARIAEILGVSRSAVSQRKKTLMRRLERRWGGLYFGKDQPT